MSYVEQHRKEMAEKFERFMHHLAFSSFDIEDIPWKKGELDTKKFVKIIDENKLIADRVKMRYALLKDELEMFEKKFPNGDTHIIEYRIEELEKALGLR